MNKLFSKIAALSVGLAMAVGVGVALGHEGVREVRAEEATMAAGTNGSSAVVNDLSAIKVGTSKNGGNMTITVGAGATSVSFYAVAWKGASVSLTASISVGTMGTTSFALVADDGASNNSPFRINTDLSTFLCTSTLSDVTSESVITLSHSSKRFIVWGASYETGGDPSQDTLVVKLNDSTESPVSVPYKPTGGWLFYANDKDGNDINSDWTSSDESVFTVFKNGNNVAVVEPQGVGTANLVASAEGFNDGVFVLTITPGELESLEVTGSMSKTSYYVGEAWSPAGLVATGTYDTGYVGDITSEVEWSYSPAAPATSVTSVVATATVGSISGDSAAQSVTVTKVNPLQVLYGLADNTNVDVYGVYVGFLDGTGPVIMDGDYGMVCYSKSADVSGYTAGETILHVTGKMGSYNGLRQIGSPVLSVASGTYDVPDSPVVYATKGGETAEYASRLTTVTGTATVTKGSFDSEAGTADITMSFTVGAKTVQVFYKKAAQTADAEAFAAMKAAVTDSTEITIKGFTGWYNGFQVQMNGYVPAAEGYTAEQFAQDLLDQTDAVCAGWKEGDNNHDALVAIWSNLAANDKYPSLPSDQKTILAEAERDEEGTVIEQAMARYDFLTGKYELSNFINGRTPIQSNYNFAPSFTNNNSYIIIIVISAVSVMSFGLALFLRKKRSK